MSVIRTDVPFVGVIEPITEIFVIGLSDKKNPQLYYWACYSTNTHRIVFGAGLLGSGISGIIDADLRPIYFSYSSYSNNLVQLNAYADSLGNNLLGSVSAASLILVIVSSSPSSINLLTTDPHMNINNRLLYGVRYSTSANIYIPVVSCSPNTGTFQGICSGFNLPLILNPNQIQYEDDDVTRLSNTYGYLSQYLSGYYLNFFPVRYRRTDNCSIVSGSSGYLPNTMIMAQCYLSPNTSFGQSDICGPRGGLTNVEDCAQIGFNYYYALSECGQSYLLTDMLGQQVDVATSRGQCGGGVDCWWGGSVFSCGSSDELPTARIVDQSSTLPPIPSSTPSLSAPSTVGWLAVIGLIVIILVIVMIIILGYYLLTRDRTADRTIQFKTDVRMLDQETVGVD